MSDDERTCCDCRWQTQAMPSGANHCRYCKQNGGREDNFTPKPKPIAVKPTRVDIDATGRKALDLGPTWSWVAAEWRGPNTLWVNMARKADRGWEAHRVCSVIQSDDFVFEEVGQ